MKVEETLKSQEINQTEERLNDLPVTQEQAEDAKGGTDNFSLNYAKINFDYKPQKPD